MRGLGLGLGLKAGGSVALTGAQRTVKALFESGVLTDILDPNTYTQTESRASGALDFDGSVLANNVIARRDVRLYPGKSVSEVYIEQAVTRINDAAVDGWTTTGAAAVTNPSTDIYQCSMANAETVYEDRTVVATGHTLGMQVRLISGSATGLTAKFQDVSAGTAWASIDLSGIGSGWTWFDAQGNATDTDGRVIFTAGATVVFEVRYVQLTETARRMRFVPGSGAGVTKAKDDLRVTSALADDMGLFGWYSQPGTISQIANTPRLWTGSAGKVLVRYSAGDWQMTGANIAAAVGYTIDPAADKKWVIGADWNDAIDNEAELFMPDTSRGTSTLTAPDDAQIHVGHSAGNNQINGSVGLLKASRRLTVGERADLATVLGDGEAQDLGSL